MSGVRLMSSNSDYSSSNSTTHIILPFYNNFINNNYTVCLVS